MRRSTFFLVGLAMMLLNCAVARGQGCAVTLQKHFNLYTSIARDGNKISTTVSTQGYATVVPGPGCPMGSATHKAQALNTLGSTGGSEYGPPSCANCYLSITNSQEIVGVPGVEYPWDSQGAAICSIVGQFWGGGGSSNIPGCTIPSTETTADAGFDGGAFREQFNMTLSDSAGDNFNGQYIQEATTQPGTNTCWWANSRYCAIPRSIRRFLDGWNRWGKSGD